MKEDSPSPTGDWEIVNGKHGFSNMHSVITRLRGSFNCHKISYIAYSHVSSCLCIVEYIAVNIYGGTEYEYSHENVFKQMMSGLSRLSRLKLVLRYRTNTLSLDLY